MIKGLLTKLAGLALKTKIIAGVTAAAVLVGGTTTAVVLTNRPNSTPAASVSVATSTMETADNNVSQTDSMTTSETSSAESQTSIAETSSIAASSKTSSVTSKKSKTSSKAVTTSKEPTLSALPKASGIATGSNNNSGAYYTVVIDGWVYASVIGLGVVESGLYKIKIDGSGQQKLTTGQKVSEFIVIGDWIYYNVDTNDGFFRIKNDGTGMKQYSKYTARSLNAYGDYVYYTDAMGSFNRIQAESGLEQALSGISSKITATSILDGWLYYSHGFFHTNDVKDGLFRIKLDSTTGDGIGEEQKLCDVSPTKINAVGGWIYYFSIDTLKYGLYRIKPDGSQKQFLGISCRSDYGALIIGDWIYAEERSLGFIRKKIDGSNKELVYSCVVDSFSYLNYSNGWISVMSNLGVTIIRTDGSDCRILKVHK